MMSLIGSLYTSMSALQTTQALSQITSANIANVNTPGYTKKNGAVASLSINGQPSVVNLAEIQRTVDEQLLRQIRVHIARLGGLRTEDDYLNRTQGLFGNIADDTSLSHRLTDLSAAFENLASAPDSPVNRSGAIATAQQVMDQLNYLTSNLQQMRLDADQQIEETVTTINTTINDIADLNLQIANGIAASEPVGDLQDQRDLLITELSELMDIQYFEKSNGEISISTLSGRTLIGNLPVTLSYTASAQLSAEITHNNGIGGILYGTSGTDITSEIRSGRLDALIKTRDNTLVDLQAEIDRLSEALQEQLNAIHNDGTAFPPPTSLTGTRTVASTDRPSMTGTFRVAVTDSDGLVVENLDIDLSTLSPPSIGQLVTTINGMTNATASINSSGKVVITATGGNAIAVNEMDSAVTTGNGTRGMGHFLGLNDLVDSGDDYDRYTSDRVSSNSSALGIAGTLSFNIAGVNTNVAYTSGQSLATIATNINTAVGASNITASVVQEGDGYRLQISDSDGDNFFITDSGTLTSSLNIHAGRPGTAGRIAVHSSLVADHNLLSSGELSSAGSLAVGAIGLASGDGSVAQRIAAAFTSSISFGAAGGLPAQSATLTSYATDILSRNSTLANSVESDLKLGENFQIALETRAASVSQVNLDEELSQLILLQNAYSAAGRLTSVIQNMMDELIQILR